MKTNLNGIWKFALDHDKKGVENGWYQAFSSDCDKIVVPSCWNNEFGKYEYEGVAWYSTNFTHTGGSLKVNFGAVANYAAVYLDGELWGEHYGGFTSFSLTKKNAPPKEYTLTVMVDNTHDDTSTIPLAVVDWYHYGGITRAVEAVSLADFWIDDVLIKYNLSDCLTRAEVDIEVVADGVVQESEYDLYINNDFHKSVKLRCGTQTIKITLDNIKLWDIDSPYLYHFKLSNSSDEKTVRTGFRKVGIDGHNIMLNNKPIKLKGINRHEEHPEWGFAMPQKLAKKDIDILQDLGCNAVRGSHYPNSHEFIDFCDEAGMLFWSEIPMWQITERALNNPLLQERAVKMTAEMVNQYYNHPSIIIWGLHNECDTQTTAARDLTIRQRECMDNSRLVTLASNKPFVDICFKYCDFISINKYYGWYEGGLEKWNDFLEEFDKHLETEGLSHLPIVMSEFGAAGMFGDCNFEAPKWSENYQSKYLATTLDIFASKKNIAGTFVWQFCDIRVCPQKSMDRARSFNNKGILNEYRKPKLAYYTVRERYRKTFDSSEESK